MDYEPWAVLLGCNATMGVCRYRDPAVGFRKERSFNDLADLSCASEDLDAVGFWCDDRAEACGGGQVAIFEPKERRPVISAASMPKI